jgi:type VI secretion system protein VasD
MLASRQWLRRFAAICGMLVVACASPPKPPPPPPPTIVQASVEALANVNPDARGRPSPVVVKFYELKSLAVFDSADFFSLFERDREILGAELVAREEFQLVPGDRRTFERTLQPDTRYLGVVAAFRDLERSVWRAAVPVTPHKTVPLAIQLDAHKVVMGSAH